MDLSAQALDQLTTDELRALHEQYRRAAEVTWHALSLRVGRVRIDPRSWADIDLSLQISSDPAINAAFSALGDDRSRALLSDGAPPPSERAVTAVARDMCLEGYAELVVAEHVVAVAMERGLEEEKAMQSTANGIGEARRARRAAA